MSIINCMKTVCGSSSRKVRFNAVLNRGLPRQGEAGGKNPTFLNGSYPLPAIPPQIFRGCSGKILAGIFSGLVLFGAAGARAEGGVTGVPERTGAISAAPAFVPIVVDQQQYQAAMQYLGGLKFNDAAPVVKWLNELEERARGQWEADHAPKGDKPVEGAK